jgi:hypothetical protein
MADWRRIRTVSKAAMLKRVARFAKLKGSDGGLPDSKLPEARRRLYAVIGFSPPNKGSRATTSPVGDDASAMPAIAIAEGFNLGYSLSTSGTEGRRRTRISSETSSKRSISFGSTGMSCRRTPRDSTARSGTTPPRRAKCCRN